MSETTETGPVLGEDARNAVASQLVLEYVDPDREPESWEREQADDAAHEVLDILAPHVAALVTEAERRGEARGAQAERDRIAASIEAADGTRPRPGETLSHWYLEGFSDGLTEATAITVINPSPTPDAESGCTCEGAS